MIVLSERYLEALIHANRTTLEKKIMRLNIYIYIYVKSNR